MAMIYFATLKCNLVQEKQHNMANKTVAVKYRDAQRATAVI